MEEFDESVLDIVGLSDYEPRKLPGWLRQELLTSWRHVEVERDDDEALVETSIARRGFSSWLGGWGRGTIDGKDVLICESEALLGPVVLADELGCGVQFVDPAPESWNYTLCFTQTRLQRRSAGTEQLGKQRAMNGIHAGD